jgi:heat shock protein beta
MAKKLVRKALEMLRKLATGKGDDDDDEEEDSKETTTTPEGDDHPYIKFWKEFGKSIKMGVIEDSANRSKLAKLLRFKSSTSDGKYVSFEEYIANKQEWQNTIYYIAGESLEATMSSPFLEVAKKKNVEVLLLTDPIDEYAFQHLGTHYHYHYHTIYYNTNSNTTILILILIPIYQY